MIKKVVLLALLGVTVQVQGGLPKKSAPATRSTSSKSSTTTKTTTTTTTSGGKTTSKSSFFSDTKSSSKAPACSLDYSYKVKSVCYDDQPYDYRPEFTIDQCKK